MGSNCGATRGRHLAGLAEIWQGCCQRGSGRILVVFADGALRRRG